MKLKDYAISLFITVLVFGALLFFFDVNQIIKVISNANPVFLLGAVFFYALVLLTMGYRIKIILDKMKHKMPFLSIMNSNVAGMLASDFTPARSGYFFTAFSLSSKSKIPINDSILTILGPQLVDFTIKAVSAAVLVSLLVNSFEIADSFVITVLSIIGIFSVIIFCGALVFVKGFIKKFKFIEKFPFGDKIYSLFYLMEKKSDKLMDIKWRIIGITIVSWNLKVLEWFCLSKAVGITIFDGGLMDYLFILIFQGAITLIHFIPLPTIAGGGASELGFTGILLLFGVPVELGLSFAILTRILMIFVDLIGLKEIIRYAEKESLGRILQEIDSIKH